MSFDRKGNRHNRTPTGLRALSDPDQEHLIAIEAEAPEGFAVPAGLRGDPAIELRRIVMSPAHRRTGRGPALLTAVLARAYHHQSGWMSRRAITVPERCMNPKASPPPKLSPMRPSKPTALSPTSSSWPTQAR